jgi:hypothetical protein
VERVDATRVFTLDNASPIEQGMSPMYRVGTKMVIDATRPLGDEMGDGMGDDSRFERALPPGYAELDLERFLA